MKRKIALLMALLAVAALIFVAGCSESCPQCNGTGDCPACNGTGKISSVSCPGCLGTGDCQSCDGKGKL